MSNLLENAIILATSAHRGQVDLAGEPYIRHPLRVMEAALAKHGLLHGICGVLHDVVEDTDVTLEDIRLRFGPDVQTVVDALTRRKPPHYPVYETHDSYNARVAADPIARAVKRLDLEDNYNPERLGRLWGATKNEKMIQRLILKRETCLAALNTAEYKPV